MRVAITCTLLISGLLFPVLGSGCESVNREQCKQRFAALVTYRTEAIHNAFGDLITLPTALQVRFVAAKELAETDGKETYDQEHRTLVFPRRLLSAKVPNPMRSAAYYWPFYENDQYRTAFPVVETIDQLIWTAYLQEAAKSRGLSWPHRHHARILPWRSAPRLLTSRIMSVHNRHAIYDPYCASLCQVRRDPSNVSYRSWRVLPARSLLRMN